MSTDRPIYVKILESVYNFCVFQYDEDKQYINNSFKYYNDSANIDVGDARYIRLVLYKIENLAIELREINNLEFTYSDTKSIRERVDSLEKKEDELPRKLKYVAFGDSLTIGRRSDDWVIQTDRAYPAVFGKYFNYDVVNLGIGGQGLTYNDTPADIKLAYDHVVEHHADILDANVITLKWGNNDRGNGNLNGCVSAYKKIFDYIKAVNPYTRIIVLSPNNVSTHGTASDGFWYNGIGKFTLNQFNFAVEKLCNEYGFVYVDVTNPNDFTRKYVQLSHHLQ